MKKSLYLIAGFICLGLGGIGVILPILPTVPFFMATVLCFAKSSEKLHSWFVETKIYKEHVEPFVEKKGMTLKAKLSVMISLTILMGFGFCMMENVPVGRVVLAVVWFGHMVFFAFRVKTMKKLPCHNIL